MYTRPLRTIRFWIAFGVAFVSGAGAAAQVALADPPDRVARLSYVEGAVSLAPAAAEEWVDAALNRPLTGGDRVWVDAASRAELQIDTATIHVDQNTSVSFVALDDSAIRLRLTDGAVVIHVRSIDALQTITVETNNATVALRQAGEYAVATDASGQTIVKTRRGECDVSGAAPQSYLVGANEQAVFVGDPLQAEWVTLAPRNAFEIWSNAREERHSSSVAARYVSMGTIGYQDLDAYGSWSHEPEYGAVWRPTLIARDWAPYRYGRWVWVSPWGWTWIDDARWGFAPFHYGRWAYVRQHWCWVPGPPRARAIYAPALVAWAGDPGRGFNHVGWFPLGPRDFYLPGYQASWRHLRAMNAGNVAWFDEAALYNAYHGRATAFDYHNRGAPHALTIVSRDAFVSGHRTHGSSARIDPHTTRSFREQGRTPDIQPNRLSVLGAAPARRAPIATQERYSPHGGQSAFRGDGTAQKGGQSVFRGHSTLPQSTLRKRTLTPFTPPETNRVAAVPSLATDAPTQRHSERTDPGAAWAPRSNPPATGPTEPAHHPRALLGYARPSNPLPAPSARNVVDAATVGPALPAQVPAGPRVSDLHQEMRGQKAAKREWAAAPNAEGQAPAATRHGSGRAERAAREPGSLRPGIRGAPRGGEASPLDLTR